MLHAVAPPSPVGSEIFVAVALAVLSLGVLLILRYYLPLRTTPAYLLVPVFLAIWLPAGIILLVPIDLASSSARDTVFATRGIWLPEHLLRIWWRITYWLTFALTWFILPILAEYSDAGYREPKDRILYALRENAQYQAIVLGSGVVGLVYVFASYGFSVTSLKSLVMALAYSWGLILAIYLMGHGLVAIPRRLFRNANISSRLRRLQSHAPRLYERMEDAEQNLEDLELQVSALSRRKVGSARDFRDWIEELVDMTNLPEGHPQTATAPGSEPESRILPTVITPKYMADLTRQLTRARHAQNRHVSEWNRLLQDASETQAILDSAGSRKLEFSRASANPTFWDRVSLLTPYTRHMLYYQVLPYARMFLGGVLAVSSAAIIWSEMVKVAFPDASLIRLTVVHHWIAWKGQVSFAGQVIAAFWMLYMCAAALISITEVKVWRGRALVKRDTAHESAFWYASQVARLSVPLSYNFMTFLSPNVYQDTVFHHFLGQLIKLTALGKWFDYLFPVFILVPVCATLFGLYGKIRRFFGFGDLVEDDDEDGSAPGYGTGSWREGRDLIDRELNGTSIRQRRQQDALEAGAGAGGPSRADPVLTVPGSRREAATTPFATSPSHSGLGSAAAAAVEPSRRARGGGPSSRALPVDGADDENFFQALGHRMKNTVDSIDAPRWFQDIKKPKWMGGDDEDDEGGGRPSASRSDSDGIRRWFGGDNGRVRL